MPAAVLGQRVQGFLVAAVIFAFCATPALGSVAVLIMAIAMLVALPVAVMRYHRIATKRKATVWVSLLTYFLVFLGMDFLFYGDIQNTLRAIAPSSPVLAAAIVVMALDDGQTTISHRRLGEWSSLAVVVTVMSALLIWLTQPEWQVLGRSVTDITGVNGRLAMFVGNPLPFAGALLVLGFVSLLGWHDRSFASRLFGTVAAILALVTVVFWAQSRGATLAAIPLIGLTVWYLRPSRDALVKMSLALAMGGIALMGIAAFGDVLPMAIARLVDGLAVLAGDAPEVDGSTWYRLAMYRAGLAAWWDSPIFGYGISQRFMAAQPYLPPEFIGQFSHLHNTFITHAVAGGVIGLMLVFALFVTPFATNRAVQFEGAAFNRDRRYLAWLIFLSLVGIGMSGVVLNHDVSANFLGTLLLAHLITQQGSAGRA